jgi:tagatose 1,6-diphosphate aldolase GatY/KbaY
MLTPFTELLADAQRGEAGLGAFTCYDLEVASGVLAAADRRDVGVVLLISREAFAAPGGEVLLAAVGAAAERSPARACVQLDHVADLDLIERAFELGAGVVMADGSKLPFEENVALVGEASSCARRFGGAVEAELGHIEGDEDVARAADAGGLTDPDEARRFVAATEADCLAVSIGNVHGAYREDPRLDWERLREIKSTVFVPLSLHGASGLPESDVRRAVGAGIRKVNVNAELRQTYLDVTARELDGARDGQRVMALHAAQRAAIAEFVEAKIDSFTAVAR